MEPQDRAPAMGLTLEDELRPLLALGLLEAEGVEHGPLPPAFVSERDALCARLRAQYGERPSAELPGVPETRGLFHRLGVDPTKTRPSSEALLRRVLQGKGLPEVDRVVDICNLCSLEHQLPLGLYDRALVRGAVQVRVGREDEGYPGIRKQHVNVAGRLMLADEDGPFGAPTSDSLRTAITDATTGVLVVVFCPVERAATVLPEMLEGLAGRLTRHASARVVAVRLVR